MFSGTRNSDESYFLKKKGIVSDVTVKLLEAGSLSLGAHLLLMIHEAFPGPGNTCPHTLRMRKTPKIECVRCRIWHWLPTLLRSPRRPYCSTLREASGMILKKRKATVRRWQSRAMIRASWIPWTMRRCNPVEVDFGLSWRFPARKGPIERRRGTWNLRSRFEWDLALRARYLWHMLK